MIVKRELLLNAAKKAAKAMYLKEKGCPDLRIRVKDGSLTISAWSSILTIIANVCAIIDEDQEYVVDGKMFIDILSKMSGQDLTITQKEDAILLQCGSVKVRIPLKQMLNGWSTWPEDPSIKDVQFRGYVKKLWEMIDSICHALGDSARDTYQNNINVEIDSAGNVRVTALDGYRISQNSQIQNEDEIKRFMIRGDSVKNFAALMTEDTQIIFGSEKVMFINEEVTVSCPISMDPYFNIQALMKLEAEGRVIADKAELSEAFEMASILGKNCVFEMANGFIIKANDSNGANMNTVIHSAEKEGTLPEKATLCIDFIRDAIKHVGKDGKVTIGFCGNLKPLFIVEDGYKEVIAPHK